MERQPLTDTEKDEIAELAAQKAYDKFYLAVGKNVVKKALWVLGASAAFIWLFIQSGEVPK